MHASCNITSFNVATLHHAPYTVRHALQGREHSFENMRDTADGRARCRCVRTGHILLTACRVRARVRVLSHGLL